jgi:two-component system sensor histidine kinase AgrC
MIKSLLIINGIFGVSIQKKRHYYIIALSITSLIISVLYLLGIGNKETNIFYYSLLVAAVDIFIFRESFKKKLLMSIAAFSITTFVDIIIGLIILFVFKVNIAVYSNFSLINYIINGFGILMIGVFALIVKINRNNNGNLQTSNMTIFLFLVSSFLGVIFSFSIYAVIDYLSPKNYVCNRLLLIFIITSVMYLVTNILMVIVNEAKNSYKILSQFNQTIIKAQHNYYLLAQEKQQEIRGIRHDINNHLTCIYTLYRAGKLEQMGEYINQLITQTDRFTDLFNTGNEIVDTILSEAQVRNEPKEIKIKSEGAFPDKLHICGMDLCTVFANAISNAVEAIEKIDRKSVDVLCVNIKISSFKEDLFIDIMNPIASKVTITRGYLETTKQDKIIHGFGTKNMKNIVEKYDGTIEFICDCNMFCVHIYMKNK